MKKKKYRIQVDPTHYNFKNYDTFSRWASYWYQIKSVISLNPKNILEVGIGNRTVSMYLRNQGFRVTTVDIDERLNPDIVCSVLELRECFKKNEFDVVLCSEVLEHLPFKDFEKGIKNLKFVSRKYIVLTLPYSNISFRFSMSVSHLFSLKFKFLIPKFFVSHRFNGEHYWEVGKKRFSLDKIKKILYKYVSIKHIFVPFENPFHIFFILEK